MKESLYEVSIYHDLDNNSILGHYLVLAKDSKDAKIKTEKYITRYYPEAYIHRIYADKIRFRNKLNITLLQR